MRLTRLLFLTIASTALPLLPTATCADQIRVAVASNFAETFKTIAARFEASSGHRVILSTGSTGKQYAQIRHGAPFDLFFAADSERPALLEAQGHALPGSRFTYALGKLVLWSPKPGYIDPDGAVLSDPQIRHLAVANDRLAPYGRAATEVLQARGLWNALRHRLVRGENIGQTFQFVSSGSVALGFVACSQVQRPGTAIQGSLWRVPQSLYAPIEQQAVLLRESEAARALLAFMQSETSRQTLRDACYDTPDVD